MWHCNIAKSELSCIDLGQSNVTPRQVQHQIIAAYRYPYSRLKSGTGEASCDSCRDRAQMRPVDQHEPVARAGIGSRGIVRERFGKRRIALDQMHRDDAVELLGIEFLPQCGSQSVLASGGWTKAYDAERRAAAL